MLASRRPGMVLARVVGSGVVLCAALGSCDPGYEYCVTVSDCSTGAAIEGVKVRFDHEGVLDQRTSVSGRACSGGVGAPRGHQVRVIISKDGFVARDVLVESEDFGSGGRALDVELCLCRDADAQCVPALVGSGTLRDGASE